MQPIRSVTHGDYFPLCSSTAKSSTIKINKGKGFAEVIETCLPQSQHLSIEIRPIFKINVKINENRFFEKKHTKRCFVAIYFSWAEDVHRAILEGSKG